MGALRAAADSDSDGKITFEEFERVVLYGGKPPPQPPRTAARLRESRALLRSQEQRGLGPYAAHTNKRRPQSAPPPRTRDGQKMRGVSADRKAQLSTSVQRRREEQLRHVETTHPSAWSCSDVSVWLEDVVQLPHFKPRFAHNHVDGNMLATLTHEVLKLDFLVLSLGQRRHLLRCLGEAMARAAPGAGAAARSRSPSKKGAGVEGPGATRAMKIQQIHRLQKKINDSVANSRRLKNQCDEYKMVAFEADTAAAAYGAEVARLQEEVRQLDRREAAATLHAGMDVFKDRGEERDFVERRHRTRECGSDKRKRCSPKRS